jgi:hypothetical protein
MNSSTEAVVHFDVMVVTPSVYAELEAKLRDMEDQLGTIPHPEGSTFKLHGIYVWKGLEPGEVRGDYAEIVGSAATEALRRTGVKGMVLVPPPSLTAKEVIADARRVLNVSRAEFRRQEAPNVVTHAALYSAVSVPRAAIRANCAAQLAAAAKDPIGVDRIIEKQLDMAAKQVRPMNYRIGLNSIDPMFLPPFAAAFVSQHKQCREDVARQFGIPASVFCEAPRVALSPDSLPAHVDGKPIENASAYREKYGFTAFSFDGVLAECGNGVPYHVCGKAIKPMCDLVRDLLARGERVRIMSAAFRPSDPRRDVRVQAVREFCLRQFGVVLPFEWEVQPMMKRFYSATAVQVEADTGITLEDEAFNAIDRCEKELKAENAELRDTVQAREAAVAAANAIAEEALQHAEHFREGAAASHDNMASWAQYGAKRDKELETANRVIASQSAQLAGLRTILEVKNREISEQRTYNAQLTEANAVQSRMIGELRHNESKVPPEVLQLRAEVETLRAAHKEESAIAQKRVDALNAIAEVILGRTTIEEARKTIPYSSHAFDKAVELLVEKSKLAADLKVAREAIERQCAANGSMVEQLRKKSHALDNQFNEVARLQQVGVDLAYELRNAKATLAGIAAEPFYLNGKEMTRKHTCR